MSEQSQPHQPQHGQNIMSAQPGQNQGNQLANQQNQIQATELNDNHATNERDIYFDSSRPNPAIEMPMDAMQTVGLTGHLDFTASSNIQRINQPQHAYRQQSPRDFVSFYNQFGGGHGLLDGMVNIQNPYSSQQYHCGVESGGGVRDFFAEQDNHRDNSKQGHRDQISNLDALDDIPGNIFGRPNRWNQDSPQNHNFPQNVRDENDDQKNLMLNRMLMQNQYEQHQIDENINAEAEEQCQMIDTSNYNHQNPINFGLNQAERNLNADTAILQQQLPQYQSNNDIPNIQEQPGLGQSFMQAQNDISQPNQMAQVSECREPQPNTQKEYDGFEQPQQQQLQQQQDQQVNIDQKQIQTMQYDNLENVDISSAHVGLAQIQPKQAIVKQSQHQQNSNHKLQPVDDQVGPNQAADAHQSPIELRNQPRKNSNTVDLQIDVKEHDPQAENQNQQKTSGQNNEIQRYPTELAPAIEIIEDIAIDVKEHAIQTPVIAVKPRQTGARHAQEGQNYQKQIFQKAMQNIKVNSKYEPPKKPASAYIIFQKEKRMEILEKKPNARVTEVVKEIAQCWQALSKEDRTPYKDKARKDKSRYEEQIKELESMSSRLKKPKKCLSAYMIFVKETRPTIVERNPDLGALDIMKKVGQYWQELLAKEGGTKDFQDKADVDKLRYIKEQQEFYDEVGRIRTKGAKAEADAAAAAREAEEAEENRKAEAAEQSIMEEGESDEAVQINPNGLDNKLVGTKRLYQELVAAKHQGLVPDLQNMNNPMYDWKQKSSINDFTVAKDQMFHQNAAAQNGQPLINNGAEAHVEMLQLKQQRMKERNVQREVLSTMIDKNRLNIDPCGLPANLSSAEKRQQKNASGDPQQHKAQINLNNEKGSENVLEKPKKPQNAFEHYHQQAKQEIITEYDNNQPKGKKSKAGASLPQKKIAKIANEKWQHLTKQEKEKYERMAEQSNQRYDEELKAYKRNLQLQKNSKKKVVEQVNIQETSSMEDSSCLSETGKLKRQKLKGGKPRLKKDFINRNSGQNFVLGNQNLIGQPGEQEVIAMRTENSNLMNSLNSQQKPQLQNEKISINLENLQNSKNDKNQIDMSAIGGNLLPLPKAQHQQSMEGLANILNQQINNISSVNLNPFNNVIKERLLNKEVHELGGPMDDEIHQHNIMGDHGDNGVGHHHDKFGQGHKDMHNEKSQEPLNRNSLIHDQSIPLIQGIEKYNKMEKMPNDKSIDLMHDRSERRYNDIERRDTGHFGNNQELADAIDMSRTMKNERYSLLSQKPTMQNNNSDLTPELITQDIFNDENVQKLSNTHNMMNQSNANQQIGQSQLQPSYLQQNMRNQANQQRQQLNMNALGQLSTQQLLNLQQANGQLGLQTAGLNTSIPGLQTGLSIQDQIRLLQLQNMSNFQGGLPIQQNGTSNGLNDYQLNQSHLGNSLNMNLLNQSALSGLGNNMFQLQNNVHNNMADLNKIGFNNALIQQHQHYLNQINGGTLNNQINDKNQKSQQSNDQNQQAQDMQNNSQTQVQQLNQYDINDKLDKINEHGMNSSQPKQHSYNDKQVAIKEHVNDMIQEDKADKKGGGASSQQMQKGNIKSNDQQIAAQEQNKKSNGSADNSQNQNQQHWSQQQQAVELAQLAALGAVQNPQGQFHQEEVIKLQQRIQQHENTIQELKRSLYSQKITSNINSQANSQQIIESSQIQQNMQMQMQKGQNDDNSAILQDKATNGSQMQQDQKDGQSMKKNQDLRMNKQQQQQIQKTLYNSMNQQQLMPNQNTLNESTQSYLQQQKMLQQNQIRSMQLSQNNNNQTVNKVQINANQNNSQLIQQQITNKLKYVNPFDKSFNNTNSNRVIQQTNGFNQNTISCNPGGLASGLGNQMQMGDQGSDGAQQQYQQMMQQQQLLMRQQFQQQQARQSGNGLNVGNYGVPGLENMNNVNSLMTNQNNLNMLSGMGNQNSLNSLNGMQNQRNVGMNPQGGAQSLGNFNSMNINMSMNMNLSNLNGIGGNFGSLNGLGGHLGQNLANMQSIQSLQNTNLNVNQQQSIAQGQVVNQNMGGCNSNNTDRIQPNQDQ